MPMTLSSKQLARARRQGRRKGRRNIRIEKRIARDVRRMYNRWLRKWLPRIGERFDLRLKLDSEFKMDSLTTNLGALMDEAFADWSGDVEAYAQQLRSEGFQIAGDPKLDFTPEARKKVPFGSLEFEPYIIDELNTFVANSVRKIKGIGSGTADQLQDIVINAVTNDVPVSDVTRQIKKLSTKFGKTRANLIARDQVGSLSQRITKVRAQAAGQDDYIWVTMNDDRVRDKHEALERDLRTFGVGIDPGEEIACRCVAIISI